jgi:hypothetical protein
MRKSFAANFQFYCYKFFLEKKYPISLTIRLCDERPLNELSNFSSYHLLSYGRHHRYYNFTFYDLLSSIDPNRGPHRSVCMFVF